MQVYRIAKAKYINDYSGAGAHLYGGRWNHRGVSVLYTSESRALATVEYLVHLPMSIAPVDLRISTIEIPDHIVPEEVSIEELPGNWKDYPAPVALADIGNRWAMSRESLLLRVPSSVVYREFNILINPLHPDINHIKPIQVEEYQFDKRLL